MTTVRLSPATAWLGLPVVALLAYVAIAAGRPVVALAPIILLVLLLLSLRGWLSLVTVVLAICSVIWVFAYPSLRPGGILLYTSEALLLLCVAAAALWSGSHRLFATAVLAWPGPLIIGFLLACIGGVFVGKNAGVPFTTAASSARGMLFYASYWVAVVALLDRRGWDVMVRLAAILGVVLVILQAAQVILGTGHLIFVIGSYRELIMQDYETAFLRVRPPGLTLVYVVAGFAAAHVLWGPARRRLLASGIFAVTFAGVVLSLNRNMLVGLALGLGLAGLVAPNKSRTTVIVAVLAITVPVAIVAATYQGSSNLNPVVQRALSLGDPGALESGTLTVREEENTAAWAQIRQRPWFGIGWGTSYGVESVVFSGNVARRAPRTYVHNQYIGFWLRTGLAGLATLMAAFAFSLVVAARKIRTASRPETAWIGAGLLVAIVQILASSTVGLYLTEPPSIVVACLLLAMAAAMNRGFLASESNVEDSEAVSIGRGQPQTRAAAFAAALVCGCLETGLS